ncbi:hypothetical protein FKM82_008931 [Ascaphus truei]
MDQQLMYWLVNGNFPDNDTKVREEDVTVTTKGELNYLHSNLRILDVVPEFYDVPITCVVQSITGSDNSSLYLRIRTTPGKLNWTAMILGFLFFLLSILLIFFVYRRFKHDSVLLYCQLQSKQGR